MINTIASVIGVALMATLVHAATLDVQLVTTAQEDTGLVALYTNACNDRVQATPPQTALAGCTTSGTPARCTCTPTELQVEAALSPFLKTQLTNAYQNMLDKQAKEIKDKFPTVGDAERTNIKNACTSCLF